MDGLWRSVESAVDATPEIDQWCSGLDWVLPVSAAFAPTQERLLLAADAADAGRPGAEGIDGFALLAKYCSARGTPMYGGLEPLWGFGAPLFGPDPVALTCQLVDHLLRRDDWRVLFLPGMPAITDGEARATPQFTLDVACALAPAGRVRLGEGISRQVADLTEGYDRWLERRSAKFRRNLRRSTARATEAGVSIEEASDDPRLFDRLMAIERRSWKGRKGSGITSREMRTMYAVMIDRLRARRRLLAFVAVCDGRDVGYILGGLRARRYRGLQLSYVDGAEHLSIGNLLQDHQLRLLDRDDLADAYDLGMDFDYKRRWADRLEASVTVIVNRS